MIPAKLSLKKHLISLGQVFLLLFMILPAQTNAQDDTPLPGTGTQEVAWSPDGSLLATADPAGQIYIYDQSYVLQQILPGHTTSASTVTWSPDGQFLASGGTDSFIRIWDISTGELVHEIEAFPEGVFVLAWQPTGEMLLAAGFDKFQAWNTTTWEPTTDIISVTILDLTWSPDGQRFAYASTPDNVGIATIEQGEVNATSFEGHTLFPYSVNWSSDGTRLISAGGRDGSLRLWDAETGAQIGILLQTQEIVSDASFVSVDGSQVAAVTEEGNLYFLDTGSAEMEQTFNVDAQLWTMSWNPESDLLAVGGRVESQQENASTLTTNALQSTGFLEIISLPGEN